MNKKTISFLIIWTTLISCNSYIGFSKKDDIILIKPESKNHCKIQNILVNNCKAIASDNIRRGVKFTINEELTDLSLSKIIFKLSKSSFYDLKTGVKNNFRESIKNNFWIKLYKLDSFENVTSESLLGDNIKVQLNFKKKHAIIDLTDKKIKIPKNGFFIEFASNIKKDVLKFNYWDYPSISTVEVKNFKNLTPMKLQLYKKEDAKWELDNHLTQNNLNYNIKIILEK